MKTYSQKGSESISMEAPRSRTREETLLRSESRGAELEEEPN